LDDFGALCIFWLYIGTNTEDNAPSPKIRLKRLGNFKETLRQSAAAPAPNTYAMVCSLRSPEIFDKSVKRDTRIPDLNIDNVS